MWWALTVCGQLCEAAIVASTDVWGGPSLKKKTLQHMHWDMHWSILLTHASRVYRGERGRIALLGPPPIQPLRKKIYGPQQSWNGLNPLPSIKVFTMQSFIKVFLCSYRDEKTKSDTGGEITDTKSAQMKEGKREMDFGDHGTWRNWNNTTGWVKKKLKWSAVGADKCQPG